MKRENEENFEDMEQINFNGNQNANSETAPEQENGPTNPPKRQRRSDDEEIRLLIPSKVSYF